ncbi:helix-turn-helix domain-containing protein [Streptomyces sp. NPDC048111]|uniref:helix-turn-helix domain-containing protein n=1 Tax=Streptomyces sp. NPDC048111 TaxID=3365500 RepID=UPI00371F0ECA
MTQSTADTKDTDAMSPLPTPKERRRLREAKDLSEAQVATAVGVTRATVRSWETGRTTPRGRKGQTYARFLATIEAEMAAVAADQGGLPGDDGADATDPAPRARGAHPAKTGAKTGTMTGVKAKPHTAGTRPKTSADSAAAASRPRGRSAKPSAAASHTRHESRPAAPGTAAVPVPAKALRTGTPAGASAAPAPGRALPRPAEAEAEAGAGSPATLDARAEPRPQRKTAAPEQTGPEQLGPEQVGPLAQDAEEALSERDLPPEELTPAKAFDALYRTTAPALAQQAYLLTGRTRLARESVERAFHLAWENWPEVATDRDPAGWVRAAAYEYAMAPWHRFRRTHKHPDQPPAEPERRALLDALLDLPPVHRRTVLLYDGVGLDLPETAAETEASTPAAAGRVLRARAAIAGRMPATGRAGDPQELSAVLRERITDLALAGPASLTRLPSAPVVRTGAERRRRFWTRAAIAFTALIVSATAFTVVTVPDHHVRPVPPGERVGGVPVANGPQRLTGEDLQLRDKLRTEPARGPHRLVLDIR